MSEELFGHTKKSKTVSNRTKLDLKLHWVLHGNTNAKQIIKMEGKSKYSHNITSNALIFHFIMNLGQIFSDLLPACSIFLQNYKFDESVISLRKIYKKEEIIKITLPRELFSKISDEMTDSNYSQSQSIILSKIILNPAFVNWSLLIGWLIGWLISTK